MRLTKDELRALSKLLDEALDIPEAGREAWLEGLADPHASLRPALRNMLARQVGVETHDFLETLPKFADEDGVAATAPSNSELHAGAVVGGYRLAREIGHGGMSSVWLAERIDGVMKRSVALKFPFVHLRQSHFADRFVRERDILASLAHANIARLYDAGFGSLGQPFLVMEYIEGMPLIEHCDLHRLDLHERLRLFTQVLSAVQYAHSRLVIHRDLKPSNILVTTEHQVALLDFGIAKLTVDGEARETELTQYGGRALTPNYASPEQIAGQSLTTASDIYSLGIVLYELFTGVLPYKIRGESRGALEEAILHADPVKPSQMVNNEVCAANRGMTAAKLTKTMRGDLDTIVLKALKKSPEDRYLTAQAFSEDIARYLGNQPVLAQPDNAIYRAGKFLRRNKVVVGAVGGIVAALTTGLGVAMWQARVAHMEAHRAQTEAHRAQTVQAFLLDIFQTNSIDQSDPQKGRHMTAKELLDAGAKQVSDKLKGSPEAEEQVMDTLADMYFELGLSDEAANLRHQRIAVLKLAYGPHDTRVADALITYAEDISNTRDRTPTLAALNEAKDVLDARRDYTSPTRGRLLLALTHYYRYVDLGKSRDYSNDAVDFFRLGDSEGNLEEALRLAGKIRDALGDYEGALGWHRRAIDYIRTRHAGKGTWMIAPMAELAVSQLNLLDVPGAESTLRASSELARKLQGEHHIDTLRAQEMLGNLLHETSRRGEGRALLRSVLDVVRRDEDSVPSGFLPEISGFYGAALLREGQLEAAESYLAADAEDLRKNFPGSSTLASRIASIGELFTELGRHTDAEKSLTEAFNIWQATARSDADPTTGNRYILGQARLFLATGNPARALDRLTRITLPRNAAHFPLLLDDINAKIEMTQAHLQQGRTIEALTIAQAALESVQRSPVRLYYQTLEADASLWFGEAQCRAGQLPAARVNLERAVQLRGTNDHENSPRMAQAQIALANCLLASGDRQQAQVLFAKATAIQRSHKELGDQFTRPLRDLRARLALINPRTASQHPVPMDSAM
jgi:serine/threonine protein kinase/tetratricopeptide (TPR) repeat protein